MWCTEKVFLHYETLHAFVKRAFQQNLFGNLRMNKNVWNFSHDNLYDELIEILRQTTSHKCGKYASSDVYRLL